MISYLKAKKSLVSPDDVQWYVETKEWSKCSESCAGGTVPKVRSYNTSEKRPLDSRTRTTTTTRIDLKFFRVLSKIDTPELLTVLFFTRKVSDVIGFKGG